MKSTQSDKRIAAYLFALIAGIGLSLVNTGCDQDYVEPYIGDPSVMPEDFSPYGYDYDMYDIFTEDI